MGVFVALMMAGSPPPLYAASTVEDLEFLDRAQRGGASERAALWKEALAAPGGEERTLRIALLQSIPGSVDYDPVAARHALHSLIARNPSGNAAAVARLQMEELKSDEQCLTQTRELQRRLTEVVDIERQMDLSAARNDGERHAPVRQTGRADNPR